MTRFLRRRRGALATWALIGVAVLSGCRSSGDPVPESITFGGAGIGARLSPVWGSAVTGTVTFVQREGHVAVLANLGNAADGREYRVVIHATGNCSSPNAFSAGPPWTPPGVAPDQRQIVIGTNSSGTAEVSARLPGWRVEGPDGIRGRSVVVHEGAVGSLEAQPGVRNNRVACGVVGQMKGITF